MDKFDRMCFMVVIRQEKKYLKNNTKIRRLLQNFANLNVKRRTRRREEWRSDRINRGENERTDQKTGTVLTPG